MGAHLVRGSIGHSASRAFQHTVSAPLIMGAVGFLALTANVLVTAMLYASRTGDSNMRSVWICSRSDALGKVTVVLVTSGLFTTREGWPDIAVALAMGTLSLAGAWQMIRHVSHELQNDEQLATS